MMYNNKFVVALKTDGKVLREFNGDKVYVPFGSEYSIFLKNKHSRRCKVNVTIDGRDVSGGGDFVINALSEMEIERFITNGNLNEGNHFKFIERTDAVAEHRGIDIEDGLICITFQLEKQRALFGDDFHTLHRRGITPNVKLYSNSINHSVTNSIQTANEVGVTAEGSISDQTFVSVKDFPVESEKTVFVFQILGETEDNTIVREPVTVKTKPKCKSCGTINRIGAKFCVECGTSLRII